MPGRGFLFMHLSQSQSRQDGDPATAAAPTTTGDDEKEAPDAPGATRNSSEAALMGCVVDVAAKTTAAVSGGDARKPHFLEKLIPVQVTCKADKVRRCKLTLA